MVVIIIALVKLFPFSWSGEATEMKQAMDCNERLIEKKMKINRAAGWSLKKEKLKEIPAKNIEIERKRLTNREYKA
jgi:hypothetical protein